MKSSPSRSGCGKNGHTLATRPSTPREFGDGSFDFANLQYRRTRRRISCAVRPLKAWQRTIWHLQKVDKLYGFYTVRVLSCPQLRESILSQNLQTQEPEISAQTYLFSKKLCSLSVNISSGWTRQQLVLLRAVWRRTAKIPQNRTIMSQEGPCSRGVVGENF